MTKEIDCVSGFYTSIICLDDTISVVVVKERKEKTEEILYRQKVYDTSLLEKTDGIQRLKTLW